MFLWCETILHLSPQNNAERTISGRRNSGSEPAASPLDVLKSSAFPSRYPIFAAAQPPDFGRRVSEARP